LAGGVALQDDGRELARARRRDLGGPLRWMDGGGGGVGIDG
jgi:hypothetical protein